MRPPHKSPLGTLVLALVTLAAPAVASAAEPAFDPVTGYRIAHYRAPTPATVPGGTTVTLEELEKLRDQKNAILLDVTPSEGAGADPVTGIWSIAKPRLNMAVSIWLPDVGKGTLTPVLDGYFRDTLKALTGGDTARAIVIYCMADCWMSWNAVRRAASYGYTALYWYPDGTDGMRDWDVPLVAATPVPVHAR
jgi:PQQ-dependent catabolism-associated CXXCW motif protein